MNLRSSRTPTPINLPDKNTFVSISSDINTLSINHPSNDPPPPNSSESDSDTDTDYSTYSDFTDLNMDPNSAFTNFKVITSMNAQEIINHVIALLDGLNLLALLNSVWYFRAKGLNRTDAELENIRNGYFPAPDPALDARTNSENKKEAKANNNFLIQLKMVLTNLLSTDHRASLLATLPIGGQFVSALTVSQILDYIKGTFLGNIALNGAEMAAFSRVPFSGPTSRDNAPDQRLILLNLITRMGVISSGTTDDARKMEIVQVFEKKLAISSITFQDKVNEHRAGRLTYQAYYDAVFFAFDFFTHQSITPATATAVPEPASANAAYGRQREVAADDLRAFLKEHGAFLKKFNLSLTRNAPSGIHNIHCAKHGYCQHSETQCDYLVQCYPVETLELLESSFQKKKSSNRGRAPTRKSNRFRSRSNTRSRSDSKTRKTRGRANSASSIDSDAASFNTQDLDLNFANMVTEAYLDSDGDDIVFDVNNPTSAYLTSSQVMAKIDSGASQTFVPSSAYVSDPKNASRLAVKTAGKEIFISSTKGTLDVALPNVDARVVPGLTDVLISVSDYCKKHDASFVFDKHNCRVTSQRIPLAHHNILLTANLDPHTGLYATPLGPGSPTLHSIPDDIQSYVNAIYFHHGIHHQNDKDLVQFYHKVFNCPPVSTWIKALSLFDDLQCFPGLTLDKIRKNLPHDPITATGHFKRIKQGLHSTKHSPSITLPTLPPTNKKIYVATISIADTDALHDLFSKIKYHNKSLYSDLIGRFPIKSVDGYEYICVFYHPGTNYIHLEPMKTRNGTEYAQVFEKGLAFYEDKMAIVSRFIMDNETSKEVTNFFASKNLSYQYVPPNNHRSNQAERAIDTVKSHMISAINVTDRTFDLAYWPELLDQIEVTLNWMRVSTTNPRLSAYASIHGAHDFDKHPMVPLGTKVLFYQAKASRLSTWGDKGIPGHCVGFSRFHYRVHRIKVEGTNKVVPCDTVIFYPERFIMPGGNSIEHLDKTITYLTDVLNEMCLPPNGSPDKVATSKNILDQFIALRNLFRNSVPMYPHNTFQSPVQTLPSIDDIVPSNDPPITDGLPRVSPSSHPHVIPRVPTANPLLPPTLLPDRSTAASRLPKRSKDNKDDATAVHNDSPSITISPGKVTKRKYVRKSTQPTPTPPSIDEIQATIQSDNARRKIVQRNILQTQRSLQRFKVSFSSPTVTAMFHLPPIVDSSDTDELPNVADSNEPTYELAALISTDPILRRLFPKDSPRPTVPLPFNITEETDINPTLQRHLPASATGYGFNVNSKTNASIPQTQYTIRAKTVVKPSYSKEIKGPQRPIILAAAHNEYVRLIDTTKTMTFTNIKPSDCKPTYYNPVLEYKTDQDGKRIIRVRGTGGGDKVVYQFGNTSQVADTMAFKILMNALVSEDSHLITSDLKDFFLTAKLPEKVYLKILWSQLPQQTIDAYKLQPNTDSNGVKYIYGELHQALYGLPQANALAAQALKENLALHGFYETDVPCLYRHKTRMITILTHVDDFAIKLSKSPTTIIDDALFMKNVLDKSGYTGKFNWGGIDFVNKIVPQNYKLTWCGYEIHHDKVQRTVTLSMNDYYEKIASQFPPHLQPYSTPGVPFNIKYGSKEQFVIETPPDIKLTPDQLKFLQKFVGEILWYATALAHDVLTAISKLSAQQTSPTSDTFPFTIERIQGYFKQYGNHKIQFQASDMKLHIMSDASFDAEPHSKSRGGCFMWLGNNQPTLINGPVFCQSKILPGVPQSAATAEIFQHVESGKMGIYARRILRSIGYPQTPTIIFADNLCSIDFAHNNTKGRTLKTIARRTHWLKHVVRQNVYVFRYVSSKNNIADIFTKLLDKAQHDYLCNLFLLRDNMLMLTKKKSSNNSNEGVLSNHS